LVPEQTESLVERKRVESKDSVQTERKKKDHGKELSLNQMNDKKEEHIFDPNAPYPYKAICDSCVNRICSSYDKIKGQKFISGDGPVSADVLTQFDNYCLGKIERFQCLTS